MADADADDAVILRYTTCHPQERRLILRPAGETAHDKIYIQRKIDGAWVDHEEVDHNCGRPFDELLAEIGGEDA